MRVRFGGGVVDFLRKNIQDLQTISSLEGEMSRTRQRGVSGIFASHSLQFSKSSLDIFAAMIFKGIAC